MQKSIVTLEVNVDNFTNLLDLYILKGKESRETGYMEHDYQIYLIYREGVLFYPDLDKNTRPVTLLQQPGLTLTSGLTDLKNDGVLMVGLTKKVQYQPAKHFIHFIDGNK